MMNLLDGMPELLAPAFCAGMVVALLHVPLGSEVLRRGIVFIDLAIAQFAALGVIVAKIFFHWDERWLQTLIAMLFALAAGYGFRLMEKKAPRIQEALIGASFVLAASLTILLLAQDPHGGEEVQNLLAGQILWADWHLIFATAVVYLFLGALWILYRQKKENLFYVLFPVAITLSVQLVGVYLVFASLILPALATLHLNGKFRLATGYAVTFAGLFGGLLLSYHFDLPSGPVIVCSYAVAALLVFFASSRQPLR